MPNSGRSSDQTIASFAVDLVVCLGAKTAFTLTGGMAMYLNRAVATNPNLKAVYCQHEQACVAAAEGYSKASSFVRPGLAVVTAGPGVTNTITSLCSAYGDSVPVIVLAGQIKTADIDTFGSRTHGAQEVRSLELIAPCVKTCVRLTADSARQTLAATLAQAFTGRPGPVFVEIPLDVQNQPLSYDQADLDAACTAIRETIDLDASPTDATTLCQALLWLRDGKRPLVYVGHGCRIANVGEALEDYLDASGVPYVHSWLTADLTDANASGNFGAPGGLAPIWANQVLFQADRILFLGARLDLGTTAFQRDAFGAQAQRRIVDIDPAELAKFAGLPNVETLLLNLRALPEAVSLWRAAGATPPDITDWRNRCVELKSLEQAHEESQLQTQDLNVYTLSRCLAGWRERATFVPTGSGAAIETFIRFFRPPAGSRCFFGASLGAMGLGLPAAIGAAFDQSSRVVCIEGDGGIMLNLQELATLAHYAPRGFVLFILNNDGYVSIANSQLRHFGDTGGADRASGVFIPDFGALTAAFGLNYARIEDLAALEALLPTLSPSNPPIVVDLTIARSESRGPTVKTVIGEDGRITSTSLADIQW
jgi:acetolactate synthase-1/2/3 large subunit